MKKLIIAIFIVFMALTYTVNAEELTNEEILLEAVQKFNDYYCLQLKENDSSYECEDILLVDNNNNKITLTSSEPDETVDVNYLIKEDTIEFINSYIFEEGMDYDQIKEILGNGSSILSFILYGAIANYYGIDIEKSIYYIIFENISFDGIVPVIFYNDEDEDSIQVTCNDDSLCVPISKVGEYAVRIGQKYYSMYENIEITDDYNTYKITYTDDFEGINNDEYYRYDSILGVSLNKNNYDALNEYLLTLDEEDDDFDEENEDIDDIIDDIIDNDPVEPIIKEETTTEKVENPKTGNMSIVIIFSILAMVSIIYTSIIGKKIFRKV